MPRYVPFAGSILSRLKRAGRPQLQLAIRHLHLADTAEQARDGIFPALLTARVDRIGRERGWSYGPAAFCYLRPAGRLLVGSPR
jgi:hypothetical protein